jgi:hypothetical protein
MLIFEKCCQTPAIFWLSDWSIKCSISEKLQLQHVHATNNPHARPFLLLKLPALASVEQASLRGLEIYVGTIMHEL